MKNILKNCFLLLLPVFLWNLLLVDYLPLSYQPEIFDKNIPNIVSYGENFLRGIVFILPIVMKLSIKTKLQKFGLMLYVLGLLLYFSSWTALIISPESIWCQSQIGFLSPAYTTIVFFLGIGLIGNKGFIKIPYLSITYVTSAILFALFHTAHAYLVFQGLQ